MTHNLTVLLLLPLLAQLLPSGSLCGSSCGSVDRIARTLQLQALEGPSSCLHLC